MTVPARQAASCPATGQDSSPPARTKVSRCRRRRRRGRDSGKFLVSEARRRGARARRPDGGPASPTAYSPGGEILLHTQQPLAQGLQHRVPSPQASRLGGLGRRRAPPPLSRLSPHAAVAAPSASPPPSARPGPRSRSAARRKGSGRGGGPSRSCSPSLRTGREASRQLLA